MSTFTNISGSLLFLHAPENQTLEAGIGEQVTACNYFKRFTAEGGATAAAMTLLLRLDSDDGSTWSRTAAPNNPYVYHGVIVAGTTYAVNELDIETDLPGAAQFCQIYTSAACQVKVNSKATAIVNLQADAYQVFNVNELLISKLNFDASQSGATDVTYEVVVANQVSCLDETSP